MDFLNLIWKLDATAVLAVFWHKAKMGCKKKCSDCVILPFLCWFHSLPYYFGHTVVWEKWQFLASFAFQHWRYLTALHSFSAVRHAFGLLADGLFFFDSANQTLKHLDLHKRKADKADWAHLLGCFLQFLRYDSIFT